MGHYPDLQLQASFRNIYAKQRNYHKKPGLLIHFLPRTAAAAATAVLVSMQMTNVHNEANVEPGAGIGAMEFCTCPCNESATDEFVRIYNREILLLHQQDMEMEAVGANNSCM